MNKEKVNRWTVLMTLVLMTMSGLGYLIAPAEMLSIVGMKGTPENGFLLRTVAAALLSFIPMAFVALKGEEKNDRWFIVLGLAIYLILSSAVDLYGYLTAIVNSMSIPSVVFRVLIGILLLITNTKKKG